MAPTQDAIELKTSFSPFPSFSHSVGWTLAAAAVRMRYGSDSFSLFSCSEIYAFDFMVGDSYTLSLSLSLSLSFPSFSASFLFCLEYISIPRAI
jgi:hypothetical protein